MKRLIMLSVMMLFAITSFAQNPIYDAYSNKEGVSSVYISPMMFRLMGNLPELKVNEDGIDMSPAVKSLQGFYMLTSESVDVVNQLHKDVEHYISKNIYKKLMEIRDNEEYVNMYLIEDPDYVRSFILCTKDVDSYTFICLDGQMERKVFYDLLKHLSHF